MAECFFCFKDEKLTRAHLFQQGFRDVLGTDDGRTRLGSSSGVIKGIDRAISHDGDIRQSIVTALCGDCNGRWMNQIETSAAPPFAAIVRDHGLPQPEALLKVAHWSLVLAALSSELYPLLKIPPSHRREIRQSRALPPGYATFFVWTGEDLGSLQIDLYRAVDERSDGDSGVHWFHFLHAGPIVAISCTPMIVARVARALSEAGIQSVLGCIGESMVYIPDQFGTAMKAGDFPSHQTVHDLGPVMLGGNASFVTAENETDLLDFSMGITFTRTDMSFDFADQLFHVNDLPVRRNLS